MSCLRILTCCVFSVSAVLAQAPAGKPRIVTQADLPRFSYAVRGTAQDLLGEPVPDFLAFAAPVQDAVNELLTAYQIDDHATLRLLLSTRLAVEELSGGHDQEALGLIGQIRALEDKPAEKLAGELNSEVFLRARIAAPTAGPDICPANYETVYRAALKALPWATVAPALKTSHLQAQVRSRQFLIGMADSRVGPTLEKQHALQLTDAAHVILLRAMLATDVPCATPALAAMNEYIHAHKTTRPDIWTAREMVLPSADKLTPVNVVIWDSGIDLALFPGQLYTNTTPGPNEDPHGIAFDIHALPTHGNLMPLTAEQAAEYPLLVRQMEGVGDLQNGMETPAAATLKAQLAKMSPTEARTFFDHIATAGGYAHGTHVTGIAARGNPAIRLAYARLTYDHNNPHLPPTEKDQQDLVASYATSIAWFKAHGVRVVNMSWWNRPSNYEKDLADNDIGKDAAERKQLARHYFAMEREALFNAIQSAPEILFVTIAGNNNANNAFEECIPSSFVLPNLIVTGAVDQAGDETSFTSYGANVAVDANGLAVPSVVPGGATVRDSGTSMAAPQVTNLAAKLLAVDPQLTPPQLVALIREGATASEDGRRHLIDPAASLRLLQQQHHDQLSKSTH